MRKLSINRLKPSKIPLTRRCMKRGESREKSVYQKNAPMTELIPRLTKDRNHCRLVSGVTPIVAPFLALFAFSFRGLRLVGAAAHVLPLLQCGVVLVNHARGAFGGG